LNTPNLSQQQSQPYQPAPLTITPSTTQDFVYTENGVEYDQHGNILSKEFDLGIDGAFNDFSLLIGTFVNRGNLSDYFVGLAVKSLEKKGFRVTYTSEEGNFVQLITTNHYDVVWIISGDSFIGDSKPFLQAVLDYHKKGGGLMIYGDNAPYFAHANIVLPTLVGCQLIGDTPAGKILEYGSGDKSGFFDENHLVFAGINHLYEGVTICYPNQGSKLKTLAMSTDGNPCILFCEAGESKIENGGRIIVDSGWTKLYQMYWASAGQARYVVNATVWLLNLEGKFGMTVEDFK